MSRFWFIVFVVSTPFALQAQLDKLSLIRGNEHFDSTKYELAEKAYQSALEENGGYWKAQYNLGNTLFKQEKFSEAAEQFQSAAGMTTDPMEKAASLHNLGNALLMDKKIKESINAYKEALRNNPSDDDTRYNLAVAQKLLKEQQNQQQNQENNQDQEDKEEQEKKENEKNNNEGKDKNNSEGDEKKQQDEQSDNKEQNKEQGDKRPQQAADQAPKMSKEDAERILQSLQNDERKTQDKVIKQRIKGEKIKIEKDW